MPDRSTKRPRDPNQLAKFIVDAATGAGESNEGKPADKNPAEEFGRLGGLKGGSARARALSAQRRREIAKKAATTRWAARVARDEE